MSKEKKKKKLPLEIHGNSARASRLGCACGPSIGTQLFSSLTYNLETHALMVLEEYVQGMFSAKLWVNEKVCPSFNMNPHIQTHSG